MERRISLLEFCLLVEELCNATKFWYITRSSYWEGRAISYERIVREALVNILAEEADKKGSSVELPSDFQNPNDLKF